MNVNADMSRNQVSLTISRSVFEYHPKRASTCNAGYLVPFFTYTDVIPGDEFRIEYSGLIRSTTPVCPVMDDLYCDVAFFWVPNRILLSRESFTNDKSIPSAIRSWKYFLGAQDNLLNMPVPDSEDERTLPCLAIGSKKAPLGSVWDYTGNALQYTPGARGLEFPVNPFWALAYYAVWNDFYRDPNLFDPVTWGVDEDVGFTGNPRVTINYNEFAGVWPEGTSPGTTGDTDNVADLGCACVSPFHGYFGSALPWPQRNAAGIPAGLLDGFAPIVGQGDLTPSYSRNAVGTRIFPALATDSAISNPVLVSYTGATANKVGQLAAEGGSLSNITAPPTQITSWNLKADLSGVAMANINDLRMAFAEQRYYEALARSGNRYNEMMQGIYGVNRGPEDGVEFLGRQRINLNMNQVNATGGGNGQPTLGSTGAFSLTNFGSDFSIHKAATEHGTILGVLCIRPNDTFSQGVSRAYQRYKYFDYYLPQFAHTGEQKIWSSELFLGEGSELKESSLARVFGYQEYGSEYRMMENKVSGHLRPGEDMGYWTYANNFGKEPTLVDFMDGRRFKNNVDQTLQVPSKTAGFQFMYDFSLHITAVRPIPSNSIPGLIDHY